MQPLLSRHTLVVVHRWAGLCLAPFVLLTALTGAVLAFYHELDHALNPQLMTVTPAAQQLTAVEQLAIARDYANHHGGSITRLPLDSTPGQSTLFYVKGTDQFDQLFVDPYSGQILGQRTHGKLSESWRNLPGFIYLLHRKLAIAGTTGATILGIVALVWTIDCFAALWIAAPPRSKRPGRKPLWQRWQRALTIRNSGKKLSYRFDWHRAGGLWIWLLLLMFAWSSVGLNLKPVYEAVMVPLFGYQNPNHHLPASDHQRDSSLDLDFAAALTQARLLVAAVEQDYQVDIRAEGTLDYNRNRGTYRYRVNSDRDLADDQSKTQIFFDSRSGERLLVTFPSGQYAGNTITRWIYALHMGQVFGIAWQLVLLLSGLLTSWLVYTGVYLWWQRRQNRKLNKLSPKQKTAQKTIKKDKPDSYSSNSVL
ncbi:PepSY-associated TM helix domain-containing protein [Oceanobacter mangrovi]|uniref:PepSY-associated TM helix domain-containing protein n=1 Tax=Oceanobacter mangrovi TaxID=2862510 RepID=UPI001C8F0A74|nr:PepSY-associated TM helix domain-containing protein [Oceanobacter mangrovi]